MRIFGKTETATLKQPDNRTIPAPAEDAPHEAIMDFAALVAFGQVTYGHSKQYDRAFRTYLKRWHPDDPRGDMAATHEKA